MSKYAQIVFLQGDEFYDFLDKLNEDYDLALDYLRQWDYGNYDDIRDHNCAGETDWEFIYMLPDQTYYLMTWNFNAGYASLQYVFN